MAYKEDETLPLTANIEISNLPTLMEDPTLLFTEMEGDIKTQEKEAPAEWKKGDIILELYEVTDILGEGAFGTVYKVKHRQWDTVLAVKTLRADLAENIAHRKNFLKECEAWINLGLHPNTVCSYYVRDIGGLPRIFIEYLEGGSLFHNMRDGKVNGWEKILDLSIQCLAGLSFAHKKGLIHRDIKPLNCLLTKKGELKITDFGIAFGLTEPDTETGATGTPAYMPPEQWDRNQGKIGPWSDIYSFGIMVYEMCTGRRPFDMGGEPTMVLKARHLTEEPVIPEEYNRDIPECLSGFILKCIQKNTDRRFKDTEEARDKLIEIYKEITGKNYHRVFPREVDLIADGLNNRAISLMDLGKKEEALKTWEEAIKTDNIHLRSTFNRALVRWRSGEIDDLAVIDEVENIKNEYPYLWEVYYFTGLIHMERDDPDSAIKSLNNALKESKNNKAVTKALEMAKSYLPHKCRAIQTVKSQWYDIICSADCRWALLRDQKKLKLMDMNRGTLSAEIAEDYPKKMTISPDGKKIIISGNDKKLKIYAIPRGELIKTVAENEKEFFGSVISSDGKWIASSDRDKNVNLWEIDSGKCIKKFKGHSEIPERIVITNDCKYIISSGFYSEVMVWHIPDGTCRGRLGDENSGKIVAASSDSKRAVTVTEKDVILWDIRECKCLKTIKTHHKGNLEKIGLSKDLSWAMTTGRDKVAKLWNTNSERCVRTFKDRGLHITISKEEGKAVWGKNVSTVELWDMNLANFERCSLFALSPLTSTEDTGGLQSRYYELIDKAHNSIHEKNMPSAIKILEQIRTLPGYERKPDLMETWEKLYSCCEKTDIKSTWQTGTFGAQNEHIKPLFINKDRAWAVSAPEEGKVKLWDILEGKPLKTFNGTWKRMDSFHLSHDRSILVTANDGNVHIWDISSANCINSFKGHLKRVHSISMSRDNKWLVTGGDLDCLVNLWDVKSGKCLRTMKGHKDHINRVCFSGDNQYIFSGAGSSDKTIRIWHSPTGKCIKVLKGHSHGIRDISLSNDGKWLLSGSGDKTLKLWDISSGRCLKTFEAIPGDKNTISPAGQVNSVFLSPDKNLAFAGCNGGILKVWNICTGKYLKKIELKGDMRDIKVSPDCSLMVTSSIGYDTPYSTLKLWKVIWSLESPPKKEWHKKMLFLIEHFLDRNTPYMADLPEGREAEERETTLALTRQGIPEWSEEDLNELVQDLNDGGYGWVSKERIREKTEELAGKRNNLISKVFSFFKGR